MMFTVRIEGELPERKTFRGYSYALKHCRKISDELLKRVRLIADGDQHGIIVYPQTTIDYEKAHEIDKDSSVVAHK